MGDTTRPAAEAAASVDRTVDWEGIERSAEFQELVKRRRSFVLPATIFFLAYYMAFILLAGYAEDFMGSEVLMDGLTVGYLLALTQFLMVWGLGLAYLRYSARVLDPLRERVVAHAVRAAERGEIASGDVQLTGSRPAGS